MKRLPGTIGHPVAREWPLIEAWCEDDGVYVSVQALFETDEGLSEPAAAVAPWGLAARPASPLPPTRR